VQRGLPDVGLGVLDPLVLLVDLLRRGYVSLAVERLADQVDSELLEAFLVAVVFGLVVAQLEKRPDGLFLLEAVDVQGRLEGRLVKARSPGRPTCL
jgi:hypothetical protein